MGLFTKKAPPAPDLRLEALEAEFKNYRRRTEDSSERADFRVLPMQSLGKCFNPTYHEAVSHVEDKTVGEERIVQVVQTGFTMDEEVLRHAKVVVAN